MSAGSGDGASEGKTDDSAHADNQPVATTVEESALGQKNISTEQAEPSTG